MYPMSEVQASQLRDALRTLVPTFPLARKPREWLELSIDQVEDAITDVFGPARDNRLVPSKDFVYPRLLALAWMHCNLRADYSRLAVLDGYWSQWAEMDEFSQLVIHSSIRSKLLDLITPCDYIIEDILAIDTLALSARVLFILRSHDKTTLDEKAKFWAQRMLDLCQELLDNANLGDARPAMIRSLYSLSKRSRLYPTCLLLDDVQHVGSYAVAGGSYGDIWLGVRAGNDIAIKVMRQRNVKEDQSKAFIGEAVLWRQFHHPNILPFDGVYLWPEAQPSISRFCLVSPWTKYGNVVTYLKESPDTDRCSLALDIALGLDYLHSFEVVHGDLKANNILMTPGPRACLSDFGLSTVIHDPTTGTPTADSSSGYHLGAMMWQAPELLQGHKKTLSSDVYSLGYVFYELFAGPPFPKKSLLQAYKDALDGKFPERRPEIPTSLWYLMKQCWNRDPDQRPNTSSIVQNLCKICEVQSIDTETDSGRISLRSGTVSSSPTSRNSHTPFVLLQTPAPLSRSRERAVGREWSSARNIPALLDGDQTAQLTNDDIIIALMGPTGTGKSSFINIAMGREVAAAGHTIDSCTRKVHAVGCLHPDISNRKVILIDTPGFDDSERTDYDVLNTIAQWLKKTYKKKVTLSGILQFHRISDSRMRGTPVRNLEMFKELVGSDALQNVILVTTWWNHVTESVGAEREAQLQSEFWQPLLQRGSRTARFMSTPSSAWSIIDQFQVDSPRPPTLIQTQMVTEGKKLKQTSAYVALARWWKQFLAKLQGIARLPRQRGEKGWSSDKDSLDDSYIVPN